MAVTKFVWDPVFDCAVQELDGSNSVKVVYTNEPQRYGGVLSQRRGSTTHVLHADALGSTRFLTNSFETVTDEYLYDAWGNTVASTGSTLNPFKWVGRYGYYSDSSTGLLYVRARLYQPTVAQWCSVDPREFEDGINSLLYVRNSPVFFTDPTGTITWCWLCGGCALAFEASCAIACKDGHWDVPGEGFWMCMLKCNAYLLEICKQRRALPVCVFCTISCLGCYAEWPRPPVTPRPPRPPYTPDPSNPFAPPEFA